MSIWGMKPYARGCSVVSHWSKGLKPRVISLALTKAPSASHAYLPSHLAPRLMSSTYPSSPLDRLSSIHQHLNMNAQELKHFLADSPPSAVNLVIKKHFEALDAQQKRYAHYISKYVRTCPFILGPALWCAINWIIQGFHLANLWVTQANTWQSCLHWNTNHTPSSLSRVRNCLRFHNRTLQKFQWRLACAPKEGGYQRRRIKILPRVCCNVPGKLW